MALGDLKAVTVMENLPSVSVSFSENKKVSKVIYYDK